MINQMVSRVQKVRVGRQKLDSAEIIVVNQYVHGVEQLIVNQPVRSGFSLESRFCLEKSTGRGGRRSAGAKEGGASFRGHSDFLKKGLQPKFPSTKSGLGSGRRFLEYSGKNS